MPSIERLKDMLLEGTGARLLILPALALIGIFVVFPVIWNIYISMTNYALTGPRARAYEFIGLENYVRILRDPSFYNTLRVSFMFTVFSAIIGQAFLGLGLALMLRAKEPEGVLGKITKALKITASILVFIAWIIPEVVAGYAWSAITSKGGLISMLLGINDDVYVRYPFETIVVANIWRGTAFSMILFTAALEGIPQYIYEAAEIDGAGPWYRFRHIILPLISQAILVDFILITIWTYGVFTMPFMIVGPSGQGGVAQIWTLYVYYDAINVYEVSYAATAANIMFLIVLAMIIVYLRAIGYLKKW